VREVCLVVVSGRGLYVETFDDRVGLLEGARDEVSVEGYVTLLSVTSLDYSLLLKLPLIISGCRIFSSSTLVSIWVSTILGF
jgi:hypothetical protein